MQPIYEFLKDCWREADLKKEKEIKRQNAEVEVLFGNMVFENNTATIITIDKRAMCKVKNLDVFCEDGLNNYECYLVPSEFKGKIIYPNNWL